MLPPKPFLSSQPRVVILCNTFWGIRNSVHSGMLEGLKARGVKTFLLVGNDMRGPVLENIHAADHIEPLLDLRTVKRTRGKPFMDAVLNASFAKRVQNSSYPVFTDWERQTAGHWNHLKGSLVDLLSRVGRLDPLFRWQIDNIERFLRLTRDYTPLREHLASLSPILVIATNCVDAREGHYIRAAQDLGIVTLNWVLSFDNLTSRGRLPLFDFYAVWNQRMRDQVLRLYPERRPSEIYVSGTPQFDFHISPKLRWSREVMLNRLGLDKGNRYLLYAANCAIFTPSEPQLVQEFRRRCAASPDLQNHRIVVRLHPLDDYDRWHVLEGIENITISKPCTQDGLGPMDQALLTNSLLYADVCINMASTVSLDAAVLDTPVVCVGFALPQPSKEDWFCRSVYNTEHYRPVVESGGVRLALSMDQLVDEVTAYVLRRDRDSVRRQELVQSEVGVVDGRAGERVAALVARLSLETLLRPAAFA